MKSRSEWFPCLALAAVLAIGAGVAWGFVAGWVMSDVEQAVNSSRVHESLIFTRDGTPIIESYTASSYQLRSFRTLDGKKVEEPENGWSSSLTIAGPDYLSKRFTGLRWQERVILISVDRSGVWYFVHDGEEEGHGCFVGYDITTKMRIGYIGRGGLSSTKPTEDEQFPVDGRRLSMMNSYAGASMLPPYYYNAYADSRELQYLLADDGLWVVNLKKRAAEVVYKGTGLIAGGRSELPSSKSPGTRAERRLPAAILLRTPDRVIVLAADGKQIGTYPLPPTLRQFAITWVPLPGKQAVVNEFRSSYELFWFDSRGEIVRHRHVDLVNQGQSEAMQNAMISTVIPCLAPIATFVFCYPWAPASRPESLSYLAALGSALAKVWPALLATGIVGIIAACACYRRQRRWGLPYTAMWTVFVLLFGLPGYIGYLAHSMWPARLPCPHCGRRVPRDRPACFACGHEFPPPSAKGIEVFA